MCRKSGINCVDSCVGVPSGNYHSCTGCFAYVSCVGNTIYRNRPCPGGQMWDDSVKRCVLESSTCGRCDGAGATTAQPPPVRSRATPSTSTPTQSRTRTTPRSPSARVRSDVACTQMGGICIDICQFKTACQKGALYAGLCTGSASRRCCVPKPAGIGNAGGNRNNNGNSSGNGNNGGHGNNGGNGGGNGNAAGLTHNCISCIGKVSGGAKRVGKCSSVCGPFAITWAYWSDCGKPETYWHCATQMACSRRCARAYLGKYSRGVTNSCEYYARVHRGGPYGWWQWSNTVFWKKVKKCCNRFGGC
ncbi:hypothetical protein LSAT2_005641 [Lamellibrachia satsuma]|nr:hypothetical protein LSAT2_005641 [Lamellibrachia satsuma]